MSKRRRASELMFNRKRALKYPAAVVARTSGTGTDTGYGIITVIATSAVATSAYLTVASGTNIGTLVGSA